MVCAQQPVSVRPAASADLAVIGEVATETWRATYAGKIPDRQITEFLATGYSHAALERSLQGLGPGLMVATLGQQVIGYAMAGQNRNHQGELFAIYVLPKWQGKQAGWRLWRQAITYLRQRGYSEMVLWVLDSNIQARAFYERQGAIEMGERDFPVGSGIVKEFGYHLAL